MPPSQGVPQDPAPTADRPWPVIATFGALRGHLREDYAANKHNFWAAGFQAVATYRLGCWRNGISSRLARLPVTLIWNVLHLLVRNVYGIELPPQTRIGRRLQIAHQHGIVVHSEAVIGDDCLLRHGVTIGSLRPGRGILPPVLGDRVEVGAGAVLIGPIRIGDDVVIGPNAVVTTDVPAGHTVYPPPPEIRPRRKRAAGAAAAQETETRPPRKIGM